MSRMIRRRSWRKISWIRATVSGVVLLVGLPVCSSSSTDGRPALNRACHWNTCVRFEALVPEALLNHFEDFRSTFPKICTKSDAHSLFLSLIHCQIRRASRTRLHTTRIKTDYAIPHTWNLASRLAKHGCPTIYRCLALRQLLCRWWHQSGKFWIHPHIMSAVSPKIGNVQLPICEFGSTFAPKKVQYRSASPLSGYIHRVKSWRESVGERSGSQFAMRWDAELMVDCYWRHKGGVADECSGRCERER